MPLDKKNDNIQKIGIHDFDDPFETILTAIVVTNGEAYNDLFDKFEKKDTQINNYRESILYISKSLPFKEIAKLLGSMKDTRKAKIIINRFYDYHAFQIVNLYVFIGILFKDIERIKNFINDDPACNRIDVFFPEASLDLKIYALFEGFLQRKPNHLFDTLYSYANDFLNRLSDQAELLKSRNKLRKFKQSNKNYFKIFTEIVDQKKDRQKSPTKILSDIAQKYGLRDHSSILKTFQNKLPLLKEFPLLLIRYRSLYDTPEAENKKFKIKPTKMLFEIATDNELLSIGRQLDNLM